mgnify:CR=1 FL=1
MDNVESLTHFNETAAALTVYDMCKPIQKDICIAETRLVAKTGGKSGDYRYAGPVPETDKPIG